MIWKWTAYGPHHDSDAQGPARAGWSTARRPGHDELRAAAGLVLLLPLLPAPDLQVAGVGLPRHRRRADDRAHPPDRAAVPRPAPRAAAVGAAGRHGRRRAHDRLDGRPDVEGRDGEGGARVGGDRDVPRWIAAGEPAASSRAGREALRERGLHRVSHVRGLGRLPPRRARPDRDRRRGTSASHFQIKHLQCPSCVTPGSPMPKFASLGDERLRQLAIFLEASKGTH